MTQINGFRYACSDFSFPLLSHDQCLDVISLLGFDGVDIGIFQLQGASHHKPDDVFKNVAAFGESLRRKCEMRGLQIACIYPQLSGDYASMAVNHPKENIRQMAREGFLRMLEATAVSGANLMTMLPGITWEGESCEVSLKRSSEELQWRSEKAAACGITFAIEPHLGSIVQDPALALRLVQMTPGLRLTLDYAHFTCQGISDNEVEPLLPYTSHFHARAGCTGRLQSSMKSNTIDFVRIARELRRIGYDGFIELEFEFCPDGTELCDEVDVISETIILRNLIRDR